MRESKWYFVLLVLLINLTFVHNQAFQSIITLQDIGTDFIPANPIELLATYTDVQTLISCYNKCNMNLLCRTFVSDTTCRLYQGSIDTGTINASLSSTSRVAGLHYYASLYDRYNEVCDPNLPPFDRYLICINGSWNCPQGTYWNGSMCINEVYYQSSCNTNNMCREDIGLICSSSCNNCLCNSTAIWNSTFCVPIPSTCPNLLSTDSSLTALWLLDGDVHDSMNNYNGTIIGSPSFTTGYVRQAISLDGNSYIETSYIDFYRRSFTIELWFYIINITGSPPLFGECPTEVGADQCLHIGLNIYSTLHFGFWIDDVDGLTILVPNQWYHVAFVYDYDRLQQSIYLNGVLEKLYIQNPNAVYIGQSGSVQIGGIIPFPELFIGYIDQVSITYRVKTANEILDDASLVAYYSFDCGSILDSGPNLLHGSASGQTFITGRINNAIQFNSTNDYFQAPGFTSLGISNQSFSISLWIKPINAIGTLVHLSNVSTGNGWCMTILGFNMLGNITAQISNTDVYGPVPTLNVWTHIIYTFSVINGIRLYNNGRLYASSGSGITRNGPNVPLYLTLANQLLGGGICNSGNISNISYTGAIDEFRVYNREISQAEACILSS